ncbi:MAG: hypothetical protein WKF59_22645 [Chitinophagaceae bacterium]
MGLRLFDFDTVLFFYHYYLKFVQLFIATKFTTLDGGATAWRFDLEATIEGNTANGKFRMNINALGCNTGTLQWTANAN